MNGFTDISGVLVASPDILVASRIAARLADNETRVSFVMSPDDLRTAARGGDRLVLADAALLSDRHDLLAELESCGVQVRWLGRPFMDACLAALRESGIRMREHERPAFRTVRAIRRASMAIFRMAAETGHARRRDRDLLPAGCRA